MTIQEQIDRLRVEIDRHEKRLAALEKPAVRVMCRACGGYGYTHSINLKRVTCGACSGTGKTSAATTAADKK